SLPLMFAWLNAARGIVDFGDFWLIGLSGLLLMVMKVSAPMMVAVAVDQKMAHKISYPFAWGLVVLTLIWPSVSYFIRAVAYLFGNVVMALGDADYLYAWNDVTMAAIRDPLFAQPLYTVGICAFFMTIAGVAVWFSPWLAYKFSMGQVYEGVSQVASSTAGGLIGAAVEFYSANLAGHIQQQASTTQAQGAYSATGAEAKANREAGLARNQAGYVTGRASALSAAQTSAGMARAGAAAQMQTAWIMHGSQQAGTDGVAQRMANSALIQQQSSNTSHNTLSTQSIRNSYAEGQAGRAAGRSNVDSDADQSYISGAPGIGHLGAGSLAAWQGRDQRRATNDELGANVSRVSNQRVDDQNAFTTRTNQIATSSTERTNEINRQAGDSLAGVAKQQGEASAGAAYAGANTAIAGHAESLTLNNKATGKEFAGRMEAADKTREASIQAAKMQALSSVVSSMGNRVAREIEEGMELRY
ncbi:MAG: hypothetical protein WKF30_19575, partial [Pyrinomonadaceae bacterium]